MIISMKTLLWTVCMILLVTYMFAIVMVTYVGQTESLAGVQLDCTLVALLGREWAGEPLSGPELLYCQYGNVTAAMFTLLKITTLDGWAAEVQLLMQEGF